MINKFDTIIIGFEKAGKPLAGDLGNRGQKVALIEKSPNMYSRTCINKAFIPTKALENSARIIRRENLNNTDEKFAKYEDAINKKEILITKLRSVNYNKLNSNENIFINTGSKPSIPNIKGIDNKNVVYTIETLMQLKNYHKK